MKTIFVIDQLSYKTPATYLLELLLSFDHEADIFTLSYDADLWRGKFNSHKLIVSPLTHLIKDRASFTSKLWMIPSMTTKLPWPKTVDRVIVISEGWAHLMVPRELRQRSLLYLFDLPPLKLSGWKKIFKPFLASQRLNALEGFKNISVSTEKLKKLFPQAQVIKPTFPTAEFVSTQGAVVPYRILVHTEGLSQTETDLMLKYFETVKFFGPLTPGLHIPAEKYLGDHCEGTLASLHLESLVVFDLSGDFFPVKALQAGLSGRPVVVRSQIDQTFLPPDSYWTLDWNFTETALKDLKEQIELSAMGADRAGIRRQSLKLNERFFKTQFQFFLADHSL